MRLAGVGQRPYAAAIVAAPARSSVPLSATLADRIEAESARRGVPVAAIVDEAVTAYLDDESTDESAIAVGATVSPSAPRPVSDLGAQAIREILAARPSPTPALRKLRRGL
jgi:hypothetical protein